MLPESRRDKILYLGIVPIAAAMAGAFVSNVLGSGVCGPGSDLDVASILQSSNLSGPDKLKALEIYREISGRPWNFLDTLGVALVFALGLFSVEIGTWIRRK